MSDFLHADLFDLLPPVGAAVVVALFSGSFGGAVFNIALWVLA